MWRAEIPPVTPFSPRGRCGSPSLSDLFRSYNRELVARSRRGLSETAAWAREVALDAYLKLVGGKVLNSVHCLAKRAYLFTTVRNGDFGSRAKSQIEWIAPRRSPDLVDIPTDLTNPSVIHYHRQQLQIMADALNELPKSCRTPLLLNRIEGMRHRAIAARLGISVSMVETHIGRAFLHCRDR